MRKNHPHIPRKPTSRKNYLRPYGGEGYRSMCSCHIGSGSWIKKDGTVGGSINHGNHLWRRAERKANRKRARQEARMNVWQEWADCLAYNGSQKLSYLYDQDDPDVISFYEFEVYEYIQNAFR